MPSENQKLEKSRLYVDDKVLEGIGDESLDSQLLVFTEILQEYLDGHNEVVLGLDYWDLPVGTDMSLYSVLYDAQATPSALDRDQLVELNICLTRCSTSAGQSITVTAQSGGNSCACSSAIYSDAIGASQAEQIFPSMLCRLPSPISGRGFFKVAETLIPCFFVSKSGEGKELCRAIFSNAVPDRHDFHLLAFHAFPNLILHPDLDLGDFKLKMEDHFATVIGHLTYLNDSFLAVADEVGWDISRMVSKASKYVEFSDEGDKTKRDKGKMKERYRTFVVDGKDITLCCTLHTKLARHLGGRIHFHGPVPELASDKIFVAIFTHHLA